MKKLITTFCFAAMALVGYSQNCFWHENMETIDSLTSTPTNGWTQNTRLSHTGIACDSGTVQAGTDVILETAPMNLTGLFFARLSFWHICRIDFFDAGIVEISNDGGITWSQLDCSQIDNACGDSAAFCGQANVFSSATTLDWDPGVPGTVATNAMWHCETFNISGPAGNQADVRIRFRLEDRNGGGSGGYPGWYLDDICVEAAACELIPPSISLSGPNPTGTIYNLGPYNIGVNAVDPSGILSCDLTYTIWSGGNPTTTTVPMIDGGQPFFFQTIPAVNDGDSICYSITAVDNSGCANSATFPVTTGCGIMFHASTGITLPYCDNFDINQLWSDTTVSGSDWQLGQPTTWPSAAHSSPSCWEVAIDQQYQNSSETYLYSPVFPFTGVYNSSIEFWGNSSTEFGWDGVRLEYSIDGGLTWIIIGTNVELPPTAVNWYNDDQLNSSNTYAWMGQSSDITNGASTDWFKASHSLSMLDNQIQAQFRFAFTSDGSVTADGFAIDDFCIVLPPPVDAGVISIQQPSTQAPAGQCDSVFVTIQNFGGTPITSLDVTYTDGTNSGTVTWSGNLAPGASTQVAIGPCFTIPAGAFSLCAYTTIANDGNSANDTTCMSGVGIPVLLPSNCDDFEAGNNGWFSTPIGANNEWQFGTPAFGVTTGAHSGVTAWDINLTTGYTPGGNDTLYSPIYNVTGLNNSNLSVSFWLNYSMTAGNDGLWMEYTLDGGNAWQTLGNTNSNAIFEATNWYNQQDINFTGQQGWDGISGGWVKSTFFINNILAAAQPYIRFRFIFLSDQFGVGGDGVSMDDFCVTIPCANDIGLFSVQSVNTVNGITMAAGSTDSVQVTIHNFGTATQSTFNIYYTINGTQFGPFAYSGGPIAANGTVTVIVPSIYTVPSSQYNISAWVTLAGDCEPANDTANGTAVGVPTIVIDYNNPYCDDFENGNIGWTSSVDVGGDPGSVWQLGAPNFGATNTTHSGTSAWDVNLNTSYTNNANAVLTSPIFDLTNAVDTKVDFWQNVQSESGWDGTRLEYRIGGSGAWTVLGTAPCDSGGAGGGVNWYNDNQLNSSNQAAWTLNPFGVGCPNPTGWFRSIHTLPAACNNQPNVQLRYVFTSDGSVTVDGYSIDDFCMNVPVPLTTTPISLAPSTGPLVFPGQPVLFNVKILNDGTTPVTSVTATLWEVGGGTPISVDAINFGSPVAPNTTTLYPFVNSWIATPGIHQLCASTTGPNNSIDLKPLGDTTCITIQVFDSAVVLQNPSPRCYDFESGSQWVALNSYNYGPNQSWALGNAVKLSGPHSPTHAWFTSLSAQYDNRDTSSLFSPLFVVTGGLTYNLNFWTSFKTERNEDGGTLEYSTNYGVQGSWKQLGNSFDPNWMNTYSITALGTVPPVRAGWSGNSSGWIHVNHDICIPNSGTQNIVFRWRFNSDFSVIDEGWAIDDVCFELVQPLVTCVTGVEELNNEFSLVQNTPNPFSDVTTISFTLKDKGNTQLQIVDISGKIVATPVNSDMSAGNYTVNVNAKDLAGGIYFYTLTHKDSRITKKMVVAK